MSSSKRELEPVPSSTLILYRQTGEKYQIYMLRRSKKSRFMAGTWVFPGGMLEDSDLNMDLWLNNIDLTVQKINRRFGWGEPTETTLGYLVAAVRETFEESGVLLADGRNIEPEEMERFRSDYRDKTTSFEKLLRDRKLSLCLSAMSPWAHWITPEGMKKRYETRFLIAPLPSGSVCTPEPTETPEGIWIDPRSALMENSTGNLRLSPPAVVTLHQMLSFETIYSLEQELESRRWGLTVMPKMVHGEEGDLLIEPWDPEYSAENPTRIPGALLPVGTSFSRMWQHDGFWLPVGLPAKRQ